MSRQGKANGKQTALSMTRKCQYSREYKAAYQYAKATGKDDEIAKLHGRICAALCRRDIDAAEARIVKA